MSTKKKNKSVLESKYIIAYTATVWCTTRRFILTRRHFARFFKSSLLGQNVIL